MGDDDQRLALLDRRAFEQFHDLDARVGVQRSGRLVGENRYGVREQGTGNGDALLLTTRHLVGEMRQPLAQAD